MYRDDVMKMLNAIFGGVLLLASSAALADSTNELVNKRIDLEKMHTFLIKNMLSGVRQECRTEKFDHLTFQSRAYLDEQWRDKAKYIIKMRITNKSTGSRTNLESRVYITRDWEDLYLKEIYTYLWGIVKVMKSPPKTGCGGSDSNWEFIYDSGWRRNIADKFGTYNLLKLAEENGFLKQ